MNSHKIKKAFTLIELLVGMSIIIIIILGATNIDYNRLSNKQKLDIFINNIKTNFESIRNNSLAGKGIGNNLDIPKNWKIEYSKTNNGTIQSSTYDGILWSDFENTLFQPGFSISEIKCLKADGSNDGIINGIASIEFNGIDLKLNPDIDCDQNTSKILELTVNYKVDKKTVQINTLNGLFQIK